MVWSAIPFCMFLVLLPPPTTHLIVIFTNYFHSLSPKNRAIENKGFNQIKNFLRQITPKHKPHYFIEKKKIGVRGTLRWNAANAGIGRDRLLNYIGLKVWSCQGRLCYLSAYYFSFSYSTLSSDIPWDIKRVARGTGHPHGVSIRSYIYKFGWNTFSNNAGMKNRTELNLGVVVSLLIIFHITASWLNLNVSVNHQ